MSQFVQSLFVEAVKAEDMEYNNIRDADCPLARAAKQFTEELWKTYYPDADANFTREIQKNFHIRFWEMYLTCTFKEQGFELNCPKPGPDILINYSDKKVWIEAIAPTGGDESKLDSVPKMEFGVVQDVPNDKIILRFRSSISEKLNKYDNYRKKGIISTTDSYIIAINGNRVGFPYVDLNPPRILRTLFPIGHEEVILDRETRKAVDTRYQFRSNIKKASGADVSTSIFLSLEYENLSAVLFSNVDVANHPKKLGNDFILVHNPLAKNPLPEGFLRLGREYLPRIVDDRCQISFVDHIENK